MASHRRGKSVFRDFEDISGGLQPTVCVRPYVAGVAPWMVCRPREGVKNDDTVAPLIRVRVGAEGKLSRGSGDGGLIIEKSILNEGDAGRVTVISCGTATGAPSTKSKSSRCWSRGTLSSDVVRNGEPSTEPNSLVNFGGDDDDGSESVGGET